MKRFIVPALALVATASFVVAAELKSGLEAGESPSPFNVKDITGPNKGTSLCYRCQYGAKPVAAVFTREINKEVVSLIKEIDQNVGAKKDKNLCAFVVLLTDDADAGAKQLKELAAKEKITNVPLTVFDGTAGPESYKISKDAAVTVLMWNKMRVEVNYAFADAKIPAEDVKKISGDTSKILK